MKKVQLDKCKKYPSIRMALKSLFPDQNGGDHRRHVHGRVALSANGTFLVTSEREGFRTRQYVVRKLSTSEEGRVSANPVYTTSWGHLATNKMIELASA